MNVKLGDFGLATKGISDKLETNPNNINNNNVTTARL
jgi:hypothetical protein